jgi:ABC-type multidrug transport system ATPase subunit
MTGSPSPLLVVEELGKRYGRHQVLDGVSFAVEAGTVTAVAGANGTGKSTLLRCLAGLARFEGSAMIGAQALDGSPAHRRLVGYVPQRVSLPDSGTVGEVLTLFTRLRGAPLDSVPFPKGFVPPAEQRVGVLSGGQQQRVVLAAALLGAPKLLLLDEPSANLDEDGREQLWGVLRTLADRGAAVLVASPSPSDLAGVADRELVVETGRISTRPPYGGLRAIRGVAPDTPDPDLEAAR